MGGRRMPVYIDIFAGCGGISLGLYKAGWKGQFAIEKDTMAFETLKHNLIDKKDHFNWPDWLPVISHDIEEVINLHRSDLEKLRGKVDLVVGGPPCQGFSSAGRRHEKDQRNMLVDSYVKFIELVEPRMLFFENVKGFTHSFSKKNKRGKIYSSYVTRKLREIGYNIESQIIDFSKFGVPQKRERFILVGIRKGDPGKFFDKLVQNRIGFLKKKGLNRDGVTLKDAISDIEKKNGVFESKEFKNFHEGIYSKPNSAYQKLMKRDCNKKLPDSHRFPNHRQETIKKFKYILDNCERNTNIDDITKEKFKLKKHCIKPVSPDQPCLTLTTLPDDYVHYSEPRVFTPREYARIQSFDDWYEFRGKYTTGGNRRTREVPRYSQIGNAIPPLFGEQAGIALKEMLHDG